MGASDRAGVFDELSASIRAGARRVAAEHPETPDMLQAFEGMGRRRFAEPLMHLLPDVPGGDIGRVLLAAAALAGSELDRCPANVVVNLMGIAGDELIRTGGWPVPPAPVPEPGGGG